jgi:hypothetical protein
MVRIFSDKNGSGEFVIQTTATDTDTYISELAEAMHKAVSSSGDDGGLAMMGIMKNAMPIAFKLSGYKAESVSEQRTLVCGAISPNSCEVVSSAGR